MPSRSGRPLHELTNLTPVPPPHPLRRRYSAASPMGRGPGGEVECARPRKICAKREDFWDATGARTFLSAATPEYSTGSERSKALLPFDVAADKNVRAPLWFRLGRPSDRHALPAVIDRLRHLQDCLRAPRMVIVHRDFPADRSPGTTRGLAPAGNLLGAFQRGAGGDRFGNVVLSDDAA